MYKYKKTISKTGLNVNNSVQGETIETKVERITVQKEPITDGAPLIYQERKTGVQPEYNPRADRFDIAIEGMDYVAKSNIAKRNDFNNPSKNDDTNLDNTNSDNKVE